MIRLTFFFLLMLTTMVVSLILSLDDLSIDVLTRLGDDNPSVFLVSFSVSVVVSSEDNGCNIQKHTKQ